MEMGGEAMLKLEATDFHKWTNNEAKVTVKREIQSRSWLIIPNIFHAINEKTLSFYKRFVGFYKRISGFTVFIIHILIFIDHYKAQNILERNNEIPNIIRSNNNITRVDVVTLLAVGILHVIIVTVVVVLFRVVVNSLLALSKSSLSSLSLVLCESGRREARKMGFLPEL